jgi:hypothetical protein
MGAICAHAELVASNAVIPKAQRAEKYELSCDIIRSTHRPFLL